MINHPKRKILLVGLYDTNTVALAPQKLRAYVEQFPIAEFYDIAVVDLSIFSQTPEEHIEIINSYEADIIGFSTYIWNVSLVFEIIKHVKGTIILGGPQCSEVENEILLENPDVDYIISGEGEVTFKELLEHFAGRRPLEGIAGVTTREIKNQPRLVIPDIKEIPSPYERIFKENPNLEWIAYETSRGCPFGCKYCTWGYSKKMRYHSLDRVFKDLDIILSQPGLTKIYLCDSSILYKKDRAKEILNFIIDRNSNIIIRYEFDAAHLDDDIIEFLAKLPNNEFNFGVQTTNPVALKTMDRPFKKERFEENYYKLVGKVGPRSITMDLIYGLPGDHYQGYKESMDYVLQFNGVKWILTNPLILLPGADFYREQKEHGIVLRDKESFIVTETNTFSKEDMSKALKLSYLVSVVFLNYRFRSAMKQLSEIRHQGYSDTILDFFDGLPFELVYDGQYPYMVPSVARDFLKRNLDIFRTIQLYPAIIKEFHNYTNFELKKLLEDYEGNFSDRYFNLKRFAEEDAKRLEISPSLTM